MKTKDLNLSTYLHFITLILKEDLQDYNIGKIYEEVSANVTILNSKTGKEEDYSFLFNKIGLCFYKDKENNLHNISEKWAKYLLKVELVGEACIEDYYAAINKKQYSYV